MTPAFQDCDGPGSLGAGRTLRCSMGVSAVPVGTLALMSDDEGPKDHAENEFLHRLPPLSLSTSDASAITSTPRDHARCGLRRGTVSARQLTLARLPPSLSFWRTRYEPPSKKNMKADDAFAGIRDDTDILYHFCPRP